MFSALIRRPLITASHLEAGSIVFTTAGMESIHLHFGMQSVVLPLVDGRLPVDPHQGFDPLPPIFAITTGIPHTGGQIGGTAVPSASCRVETPFVPLRASA